MNYFFNQIPVKIGLSILLIETALLSIIGVYYVSSFHREIDQRVHEKLILPGMLMSQRALNYDSVENPRVIEELVQESVLETFITRQNGDIFYAANERLIGTNIEMILAPEEQFQISSGSERNQQVSFKMDSGGHARSSLSHIRHNDRHLGYLYIKIDATKVAQEKRTIVLLFLLGSLLTILLTTLFEAFYIHRLVVPRIRAIASVLKRAEAGDLNAQVSLFGAKDELYALITLVNRMLKTVDESISTLSRTQDALKSSEERFRELSDLLPEGIFELDVDGYFTYVNLRLCKVLRYSREELYHTLRFTDVLVEEDRLRSEENSRKRMAGRLNVIAEYRAIRKDGTILPVMVNAVSFGHRGELRGLRGIVVDLTEKNRLQKQLWQTQKMESIGRLSASVAHEFGNPLVGIHWLLMDIEKSPDLDESKKQLVQLGLNECSKLKHLITNFQAFAKPSSGEVKSHDINDIISDILLLYRKFITDKGVEISHDYQRGLPRVPVVKDQIHQVLVNIVMNGLDAGATEIALSTMQREDEVLVSIRDNGCGIADENLDHIFEPFYSTKSEVEGTGLGLYVSYLIVRNHHGDLQVESALGKGSTFILSLPVENRPRDTIAPSE